MMYITQNYPVIDVRLTGQRIQNLMKERGIKPTEVQDWLSLSCVQTVYRWMKGISVPSIDNLYALSQLFGVRMDDIIVGSREEAGDEKTGSSRPLCLWSPFFRQCGYAA